MSRSHFAREPSGATSRGPLRSFRHADTERSNVLFGRQSSRHAPITQDLRILACSASTPPVRFTVLLLVLLCARVWPLHAAAPAPTASSARDKAATIVIPRIDFRESEIGEALQFLHVKSRQLDPEGTGVQNLTASLERVISQRVPDAVGHPKLAKMTGP